MQKYLGYLTYPVRIKPQKSRILHKIGAISLYELEITVIPTNSNWESLNES